MLRVERVVHVRVVIRANQKFPTDPDRQCDPWRGDADADYSWRIGGADACDLARIATMPPSVQVLAGLVAAAPFSLFMGKFGRKAGFLLGVVIAFAGALAGVVALYSASFVLLCVSHFMLGAALSGFQYFRFAAAEVVPDRWKSVAISFVLASGLVAAFGGPEVFLRTSELLAPVLFAGGYAGIAGVTLVGAIPLLFLRLPEPVAVSPSAPRGAINALEVIRRPAVAAAILRRRCPQRSWCL